MYITNRKEHQFDVRDVEQLGPCLCHGMFVNQVRQQLEVGKERLRLFEEHDRLYQQWIAEGKPLTGEAYHRGTEIFRQLVRRERED